jgi:hypothetical protein
LQDFKLGVYVVYFVTLSDYLNNIFGQTTKMPYVNSIAHWLGLERTDNPIVIAKNGPTGTNWIKDMSIRGPYGGIT